MARQREVEFFSTSFLDLLSCGMGAVIVLMIIFVSQLEFAPKDVRGFYMVSVEITETDPRFLSQQVLTLNGQELMRIHARGPGDFALTLGGSQIDQVEAGKSVTLETKPPGGGLVRIGVTISQEVHRFGSGSLRIQTSIVAKDCSGSQRLELATERKRISDRLPVSRGGFRNLPWPNGWVPRAPNELEPWVWHSYRYEADSRYGGATPYPQTSISVTTPLSSGRRNEISPRNSDDMLHMTGWVAQLKISENLDASTIDWRRR